MATQFLQQEWRTWSGFFGSRMAFGLSSRTFFKNRSHFTWSSSHVPEKTVLLICLCWTAFELTPTTGSWLSCGPGGMTHLDDSIFTSSGDQEHLWQAKKGGNLGESFSFASEGGRGYDAVPSASSCVCQTFLARTWTCPSLEVISAVVTWICHEMKSFTG